MAAEGDSPVVETDDPTPHRAREYSQHEELLNQLPDDFKTGFEALEERLKGREDDPKVVKITNEDEDPQGGNYVFVSLGIFHVSRFRDYDHDYAEVFVRLKDTFPKGQHYGMVTDPVLSINSSYPDNCRDNREHAKPLCEMIGVDKVLFWSRDWRDLNIDQNDPTEMVNAVGWVKGNLSNPWENQE